MSRASDLRKALDALDVFDEATMDADFDIQEGEDADEFCDKIKRTATKEGSALAADIEQAKVFAGFFLRDDLGKVAAAQRLHALVQALAVARLRRSQAVAQHHPVDRGALRDIGDAGQRRCKGLPEHAHLARAELAAAMRTIESWSADHTPALTLGLRRCDAEHGGVDLVADYDVLLAPATPTTAPRFMYVFCSESNAPRSDRPSIVLLLYLKKIRLTA